MSTAFPHSTRTLAADRYGRVNWILWVAIGFLVAWLAWFFLARVSLYEASTEARLISDRQIVAYFPPAALVRIRPGQAAQLRLDDFLWTEYGTVAATVVRMDDAISDGRVMIELEIPADIETAIPLQAGLAGRVEVESGRVTPAGLLLNRVEAWLAEPAQEAGEGE